MSYDIRIVSENGFPLHSEHKHDIIGAVYCIGGTTELWMSMTSNYAKHLTYAFDHKDGLKSLHGKSCKEAMPLIIAAISRLGNDVVNDYFDATEGNVKLALLDLLKLIILGYDAGYIDISW